MATMVQEIVGEARDRAGKGIVLLRQIEPLVGRLYDDSSVSAWATGRAVPPGDVLMAIAKVSGISLDGYLSSKPNLEARMKKLEERLDDLGGGPSTVS
jgi:hypothetical protein